MNFFARTSRGRQSQLLVFVIIALFAGIALFIMIRKNYLNLFPYKMTLLKDEETTSLITYVDVDQDNIYEKIIYSNLYIKPNIYVYTNNDSLLLSIKDAEESLDLGPSVMFLDVDQDGKLELYVFTMSEGLIYLNGYEFNDVVDHFLVDFVVDKHEGGKRGKAILSTPRLTKPDSLGRRAIATYFISVYRTPVKRIYLLYPFDKELKTSSPSNALYAYMSKIEEFEDGECAMLIGANAGQKNRGIPSVIIDSLPHTDTTAWLFYYSSSFFDPEWEKEYANDKTFLLPGFLDTDQGKKIFLIRQELISKKLYLEKLNLDGDLEKTVEVPFIANESFFYNEYFDNLYNRIVINHYDTLSVYDEELELVLDKIEVGKLIHKLGKRLDYSVPQVPYFFFFHNKSLVARDLDFNILAKAPMKLLHDLRGMYVSRAGFSSDGGELILLSKFDRSILVKIKANFLYSVRVVLYFIIFLFIQALFYVFFRIQEYFYNRRARIQSRISSLELQSVQNQLQPHFTFNVLNAIGSMIYKEEKEKAYTYLNHFADMLRSTLLSGNQTDWTLEEEVTFIKTYLEMENLRYQNRFVYYIEISEEIDTSKFLPKMMIQSFVENAVRHGLLHKIGECLLQMKIYTQGKHICVNIIDNGIGRKASANMERTSNGLGNKIITEFITLYNMEHRIPFSIDLIDLKEADSIVLGTAVEVKIPIDYHETFYNK